MVRGRRIIPETRQTPLKSGVCQDLADHFSSGLVQDQQDNPAIVARVNDFVINSRRIAPLLRRGFLPT